MQRKILTLKKDQDPYKEVNKQPPGTYTVMSSDGKRVIKVLTKCGPSKVEQHHRTEIKKMVANVEMQGLLRANTQFSGELDDYPSYDFQEAQFMIAKANSNFEKLPSQTRAKFENSPAKFMDYVKNASHAQLVDIGLPDVHDGLKKDGSPVTPTPAPAPEPTPTA